ncbi:hypothetical protein [Afipia felis]|uniref:Helix-turn-helix domain-containing protein n=2 Tax=Afipia felis TaxID=1035 RepID=A0A380W7J2_AFIFE|nr:hypothetical protein [Afipia felis]EKS28154.1 hypothetical protein HMPREF9697_00682 [Afipia felis ATCC 53690]SUU76864.1 Uncharacterised protein [Afipia felis]SUU84930.1 Uncharacterised protein [Afipia felis]
MAAEVSNHPESILDGYVLESDFAKSAKVHPRTIARYRTKPDGLPYLEFGGRIYIPIIEARAWLSEQVKRPNPRRRAA